MTTTTTTTMTLPFFNPNLSYESLRKFIQSMNLTEEDLYRFFKMHFPNDTIRGLVLAPREICLYDPDKYCDGTLKAFANGYKDVHGYVRKFFNIKNIICYKNFPLYKKKKILD